MTRSTGTISVPILVDANVLVRLRDADSPEHANCMALYRAAANRQFDLRVCAQVLIEFWVVVTRPRAANGMGLLPIDADRDLRDFLTVFPVLSEPSDVLGRWHELVVQHGVVGKPAHDARLVALMDTHAVREVLTLNVADFSRYRQVTAITPGQLLARPV